MFMYGLVRINVVHTAEGCFAVVGTSGSEKVLLEVGRIQWAVKAGRIQRAVKAGGIQWAVKAGRIQWAVKAGRIQWAVKGGRIQIFSGLSRQVGSSGPLLPPLLLLLLPLLLPLLLLPLVSLLLLLLLPLVSHCCCCYCCCCYCRPGAQLHPGLIPPLPLLLPLQAFGTLALMVNLLYYIDLNLLDRRVARQLRQVAYQSHRLPSILRRTVKNHHMQVGLFSVLQGVCFLMSHMLNLHQNAYADIGLGTWTQTILFTSSNLALAFWLSPRSLPDRRALLVSDWIQVQCLVEK